MKQPSAGEMKDLLLAIYIARNITLDEAKVHECLRKIDEWFRELNLN